MREACEKASRGRYVRWGPFCCLDSGRCAGVVAGTDAGTVQGVPATDALRAGRGPWMNLSNVTISQGEYGKTL